jgi:hypothetical protein
MYKHDHSLSLGDVKSISIRIISITVIIGSSDLYTNILGFLCLTHKEAIVTISAYTQFFVCIAR